MDIEEKKTNTKFHILAIVCIILFSFAITPITLQNDTFYTIRVGEHIVNQGIDMKDPFSWHEDLPYTYPHWAYDTGIYLIYHLGEMTGLEEGGMLFIYISTLILSSILGLVIYLTINKVSKNPLISFFLTMISIYLLGDFIAARAQLVTFILFILTIFMIESFLETKKKRYAIGIILISISIANLHVAVWPFFFVLFLPYIAEYIISSILEANVTLRYIKFYYKHKIKKLEKKLEKEQQAEKRKILEEKLENKKQSSIIQIEKEEKRIEIRKEKRANPFKLKIEKNKAVKWLILIMVICAFTGLLTPLKDAPYTYLVKTMEGNTTKSISEHLPLTLYNDKQTMIALTIILAILIFSKVKIKLRDLFMLAGLTYLSFMTRRQVSLLFLIGMPIFAKWLEYLFNKYDKEGSKIFMKYMTMLLGKTFTLAVVILLCFVMIKPKIKNKFVSNTKYPVEASTWILENLDVENIRLYNEYNYGSYLLFRGIPVFIDSRADLYAPEFNKTEEREGRDIFSDYINISSISTYYETKFEEYGITHAIVVNNAKLNMFLSRNEKYKQIYKDNNFTIYERDE